jgi:alpha-glucosidase
MNINLKMNKNSIHRSIWIVCIALLTGLTATAEKTYKLTSPNSNVEVNVHVGEKIQYEISFNKTQIINPSAVSFAFANAPVLGNNMLVNDVKEWTENSTWKPVLKRFETISNHFNGLLIKLQEERFPGRTMDLEFRVFNDGAAFRVIFPESINEREVTINDENTIFNFADNFDCWAVDYVAYDSHQESEFIPRKVSELTEKMVTGLPLTLKVNDNIYAALTEAALVDYAGMYLKPSIAEGKFALRSQLAPRHEKEENEEKVMFTGAHKTPWRVVMLGETPGELVESEIIQNLNEPCAIEDPSWIQPGVSAWDHWWSGEVKMEQEVIYEYIDLASEMGWPFMLIDWQWYGQYNRVEADIMKPAPQLKMDEIFAYAKSKNVKCWLWLYWTDVDRADWEAACKLYSDWGAAGIKIDFMARDDQEMVNWYHRIVKTAAEHKLMVDFHGAYKPTGWRRTYPNLMTREGVLGNEHNKWSIRVTPEHMCTLPFTRMLAGPMDYTPGGFLNRNANQFINGQPANVFGTRANTLAQFVIYDSPYLVACDHPDNYKGETGVEFLKQVKSVWDDTKVLNGAIGEYITMARRDGENWFVGAMTNSYTRELEITLDFLPEGKFEMTSYSDAEKTLDDAEFSEKKKTRVKKGDVVKISMIPGGGFAASIQPIQ